MSEYSAISDKIDEFDLFIEFLKENHPEIPGEFSEWKNGSQMSKIDEFDLFIEFLKENHPEIPGEFSEWKNARSDYLVNNWRRLE